MLLVRRRKGVQETLKGCSRGAKRVFKGRQKGVLVHGAKRAFPGGAEKAFKGRQNGVQGISEMNVR